MAYSYGFVDGYLNRGFVGNLQLKPTSHWEEVDKKYWEKRGIEVAASDDYWSDKIAVACISEGMVKLQHALVKAGTACKDEYGRRCESGHVILFGGLYENYMKTSYNTPYHEDLLENWEQFVEDLKEDLEEGIKRFSIRDVTLPDSSFFSTKIVSVLNENITTITRLELVSCNLRCTDMESLGKFIKKSKSLSLLNLSRNSLFSNDGCNVAAKQLSKAMKNHPELFFVNLTRTDLWNNSEALELILQGSKGIKSLVIDSLGGRPFDKEGLPLVTNFLQKKNSLTELSLSNAGIGRGKKGSTRAKEAPSRARLMRDALQKNATLEQLCLSSNDLGINDRVFSTVMSGIKGSESLIHVDLSGNSIRLMPSIKLVAKYLARNPSLVALNLNDNGIPVKSANLLMKALLKNSTLQQLYLSGNNLNDRNVPAITEVLQSNTTLRLLDLQCNNFKMNKGRKDLLKLLCDTTSLDSIVNSNHSCSLVVKGSNFGRSHENELRNINRLENEGEKIRYKVVLALCVLNRDLYDPRSFDDVPLEIMHKVLELVQQEIGCKGYGRGIVPSVRKISKTKTLRLSRLYEIIHQWPALPSLFSRGVGKKKRKKSSKRKFKVADEEEDWRPSGGARKQKKGNDESSSSIVVGSGRSRRSSIGTIISYADVENSDDES